MKDFNTKKQKITIAQLNISLSVKAQGCSKTNTLPLMVRSFYPHHTHRCNQINTRTILFLRHSSAVNADSLPGTCQLYRNVANNCTFKTIFTRFSFKQESTGYKSVRHGILMKQPFLLMTFLREMTQKQAPRKCTELSSKFDTEAQTCSLNM